MPKNRQWEGISMSSPQIIWTRRNDYYDRIFCDGRFESGEGCREKAQYIARSEIDPMTCVYYCCEEHKESYEAARFIIQRL